MQGCIRRYRTVAAVTVMIVGVFVIIFLSRQTNDKANAAQRFAEFAKRLPRDITATSPTIQTDALRKLLETAQPQRPPVGDAVAQHDWSAALTEIRQIQAQRPERPVLPHGLSRMSPKKIVRVADRTIREGWKIGRRAPYSLATPMDWAADPHHDTSWRMWLNSWHPLEPLLLAYDQTGHDHYLVMANRIALDWIEQHVLNESENPLAWYDMAIGRRAAFLGKLIDANLRKNLLDDNRLLQLFIAARLHGLKLIDPEQITWTTNHGFYQLVGLLAMAKAVPQLNGAGEFHRFANGGLQKMLHEHFTEEGIHREHSPFYHLALVNTLGLLEEQNLIEDQNLLDLFHSARKNIVWMSHPNGDLCRAGDSDRTPTVDRILYPDDPQLQYLISQGTQGVPPAENYRIFPKSGYAMFRDAWDHRPWREASYLHFSAAFHSGTHKHADDLTFEWSELGRTLLIDSGRFSYKYDHPHRRYVESTRAHNTVEIDGRDYSRERKDAFGSAIVAGGEFDGAYFVEAAVDRTQDFDTHHRRILVLRPGQWLAVIDRLTSPQSHDFAQCFHFDPDLNFRPISGRGISASLPESETALNVLPLAPGDGLEMQLIKGQTTPRLQGWTSLAANEMTPNIAVELRTHGKQVLYVTLFSLTGPQADIIAGQTAYNAETDEFQVRWQLNGQQRGFDYRGGRNGQPVGLMRVPNVLAGEPAGKVR
ncbi:alginate lyase family protein [Symmachiella dynata]|uniref:heparinase II/III family protein n=1 Tax=Symmachiella dynata TaxID=2527995 RepID=UPI0030EF5401